MTANRLSYLEAKNLEEALRRLTRTTEELRVVIKSLHTVDG